MTAEAVLNAAIGWQVRLGTPEVTDSDWVAFTDWLEADPAHGDAYDRVTLAVSDYDTALAACPPPLQRASNDNQVAPWIRRRGVMALAASALIALLATPYLSDRRDLQTYQTSPGERRTIALNDGSKIELNGTTRLDIDRNHARYARLVSGEAAFSIRHDAANPFTLQVDDNQIVDVGTLFNVRKGVSDIEVAVGEGAIRYNPSDDALVVSAGNRLVVTANSTKPALSPTDPSGVGSWRTGRLMYRDASITRIALDLSRAFRAPVRVAPNFAWKRFSGIIQIDPNQRITMHKVEILLSVRAIPSQGGWLLSG